MDHDSLRAPLDAETLRDGLVGPRLSWRQLDVVAETGSTNADLLARAEAGADIDGSVLLAEYQSAGRGRHGRQWSAPPGASAALGVEAGLKCPNDVLVTEGKLAGILAEVASPTPVIVLGLGLNVTLTAEEAPDPVA